MAGSGPSGFDLMDFLSKSREQAREPMSEMVERAALALRQTSGVSASDEDYRRMARIVIETMREPTNDMREAGEDSFDWNSSELYGRYYLAKADPSECWKAMISAALENTGD